MGLVSYPGSGNTWVRHIIETASGIATGSVHCDQNLKRRFMGECHRFTNNTLTTKTHHPIVDPNVHKVVLIVRDPARSILSQMMLDGTLLDTKNASNVPYNELVMSLKKKMMHWAKLNMKTIGAYPGQLYLLRYENLIKGDLPAEILNLIRFLDVEPLEWRMECIEENREGNFYQKHDRDVVPVFERALNDPGIKLLMSHVRNTVDSALRVRGCGDGGVCDPLSGSMMEEMGRLCEMTIIGKGGNPCREFDKVVCSCEGRCLCPKSMDVKLMDKGLSRKERKRRKRNALFVGGSE